MKQHIKNLRPFHFNDMSCIATSPPPPGGPNKNIILIVIYLALGYWIGKKSN
jgi:hypothetical protein